MKNAHELLADVRRWICDNLSNKDAGRLCNMLAYVSRHISSIEAENEILHCNYVDKIEYTLALERKILCVYDENKKLRELAREAHSCKTNDGCCEDCYCDEGYCPIERRMQELGIEAGE